MSTAVAQQQRVSSLSDARATFSGNNRHAADLLPAVSFASHWGAVKCLLLTHGTGKTVAVDSLVQQLMQHELDNVLAKVPGTSVQQMHLDAQQPLLPWRTNFALIDAQQVQNFRTADRSAEVTLALITNNSDFDVKKELNAGAKFVVAGSRIYALDVEYLQPVLRMKILGGYSGPRE
jgi:hypothetical protein